jgi:hypothetical protein
VNVELTQSMHQFWGHVKEFADQQPAPNSPPKPPLEEETELAIAQSLEVQGIPVQRQVPCPSGRADIVTPDAIYEVKRELDTSTVFSAIGQVLIYRQEINPQAKAYVVGYKHTGEFRAKQVTSLKVTAKSLGIEILFWDGKKLF